MATKNPSICPIDETGNLVGTHEQMKASILDYQRQVADETAADNRKTEQAMTVLREWAQTEPVKFLKGGSLFENIGGAMWVHPNMSEYTWNTRRREYAITTEKAIEWVLADPRSFFEMGGIDWRDRVIA